MSWASIKESCNMRRAYVAEYKAALLKKWGADPTSVLTAVDSPPDDIKAMDEKLSVEVALLWRYFQLLSLQ